MARPDLPLVIVHPAEISPGWPAQYRALRREHEDLQQAIHDHWESKRRHVNFIERLDELAKTRHPEIPASLFWAEALEGALRTTDGFASLSPHDENVSEARGDDQRSGFGMIFDFLNRGVVLREVSPGSPADHAGLRAGDILLAIASAHDVFRTLDKGAAARIKELNLLPTGSALRVRIDRDGAQLEARLVRDFYSVPNVQADLSGGIGYVRLRGFDALSSCQKVALAIHDQVRRGARGLLLDLRDNAGGSRSVAACVAGLFIGDKTVAGFVQGPQIYGLGTGVSQLTELPLVVLVDGGSASGSELVAGALQVYRRAWIVGERTAGKATQQEVKPFRNGLDIATTNAYFTLPDGSTHQGVGITPDFTQPFRLGASDDDRFQPRIDDFVFVVPVPRGKARPQPRPEAVARIEACVKVRPAPDHQRAYAEAVLRCDGVPENGTPPTAKP